MILEVFVWSTVKDSDVFFYFFLNVVPSSDHLLWSIFQSSWHINRKAFAIKTSSPASAIIQGIHHKQLKLSGTLQFVLLHSLLNTERLMNHTWTEIWTHRSRGKTVISPQLYHQATTAGYFGYKIVCRYTKAELKKQPFSPCRSALVWLGGIGAYAWKLKVCMFDC